MGKTVKNNFYPTTGASNKILQNKCSNRKLDDVKIDPKYCITEIELLIGDLCKLNAQIDSYEMMKQILSNLPEAY